MLWKAKPGNDGLSVSLSRMGHCGPALLLGCVVVLLSAPYLLRPDHLIWPRSGLGSDVVHLYWIDHVLTNEAAADGRAPVWNDQIALGHPIRGGFGALGLYPSMLLYPLLSPTFAFTVVSALRVHLTVY